MMPFKRLFRGKASTKSFPVKIITLDAEVEFSLPCKATGRDLFDLVCRTIGLRETWYFGLQYADSKDYVAWLKMDKKVVDQDVPRRNPMPFIFLAKFFPEDVNEELVQEVTQHLFFLQVKQSILNDEVFCPPEMSVLLASYAVQARYGDLETYQDDEPMDMVDVLPEKVLGAYQMTAEMWQERIKVWWSDHRGMTRDEAEMEYLKITQDLGMYGVNYFSITNKKGTQLWLGVTALGLNVYEHENKLEQKINFPWSDIRNISVDDKRFNIRPTDKSSPNFVFFSKNNRSNKLILDLSIGNHDLFKRRRKPDSIEVQQMKAVAREEKNRRQLEKDKLSREKLLREDAEREKLDLERRMHYYKEEMRVANEALRKSKESSELLLEKSQIADEESRLLTKKAMEAEKELQRMNLLSTKTQEEKFMLEHKVKETEHMVSKLLDEGEKRACESERLKNSLLGSRHAEKQAKEKLLQFVETFKTTMPPPTQLPPPSALHSSTPHIVPPPPYTNSGRLAASSAMNSASMDFSLLADVGSGSCNTSSLELAYNTTTELPPTFDRTNLLRKSLDTSLLSSNNNHNTVRPNVGELLYNNNTRSDIRSFHNNSNNNITRTNVGSLLSNNANNNNARHDIGAAAAIAPLFTPSVPSRTTLHLNNSCLDTSRNGTPTFNETTILNGTTAFNDTTAFNGTTAFNDTAALDMTLQGITLNGVTLDITTLDAAALSTTLDATAMRVRATDGTDILADLAHLNDTDVDQLTLEIEKEKAQYLEKSRSLQTQLKELKDEIQVLKVEDVSSILDSVYEEQLRTGETKYSTLQRSRSGCTKSRVAFFEEL
uniref:Moesin/ezrin/radixin homolog 1 n=1 Tax=Hirondellea gigas TaxID=1518452 RepID=A0A2P2I5D8_9CRUS